MKSWNDPIDTFPPQRAGKPVDKKKPLRLLVATLVVLVIVIPLVHDGLNALSRRLGSWDNYGDIEAKPFQWSSVSGFRPATFQMGIHRHLSLSVPLKPNTPPMVLSTAFQGQNVLQSMVRPANGQRPRFDMPIQASWYSIVCLQRIYHTTAPSAVLRS